MLYVQSNHMTAISYCVATNVSDLELLGFWTLSIVWYSKKH
jgi:hypothetical protein